MLPAPDGGGARTEPVEGQDAVMPTPTIHLATDDALRAITSQTLHDIFGLPFLYISTDQPDVMRAWGVALPATISDYARLYPGALVAPRYAGETASAGDLLYDGAELAADFMPSNTRAPS